MKGIIVKESERLARLQQLGEAARAEQPDVQEAALQAAIDSGDEETAAAAARAIRNRLLGESDSEMLLDRLGLEVPSGETFEDWRPFLVSMAGVLVGAWSTYRQELRDLPKQEGFPLTITWPVKPE